MAMKFYGVPFMVLNFVLITRSLEESFKITRSVEEPYEKYYSSRDKFQIQTSNCSQLKCSQFDSESTKSSCYCKCSFSKPSFVYEDGKWACSADTAQIAEGCGFSTTPIYYMKANSRTILEAPQPNVPCTVNETGSRYQDCDGTWKPVGNKGRFQMREIISTRTKKTYELWYRAANKIPDIRGRIIKLILTCKPTKGKLCYFFKITGSVNCPINPFKRKATVSVTKRLLQTEQSTSSSSLTSLKSDVSRKNEFTTTAIAPIVEQVSTPKLETTNSRLLQTEESTSASSLTALKSGGSRKNEFTTTAITGVVISGVLLICLALVFAIIGMHLRKKRAERQAAEVRISVVLSNKIVNKDVATLQEAVTIETGRTQNEDYEEVNQYTNLTRSNQITQGKYTTPFERDFTKNNETGTTNGTDPDYQNLNSRLQPSIESSYEPLQKTSKSYNGKEEILPRQTESPVSNDQDYENMEIKSS